MFFYTLLYLYISGGQRHRLSFARALLKKPDILILDEATRNLVSIKEQAVSNKIHKSSNMTVIIITHKLNTIKQCDKILVMSHGSIIET